MAELYLITPPVLTAKQIYADLDRITKEVYIAAVRLRLAAGFDGPSIVRELYPIIQDRDIALMVEDDVNFAKASEADGVHLSTYVRVAEARRVLGDEANIGASCMGSRHAAMEAGEFGADYVSFFPSNAPEVIETIKWWSEMTVLPCVAEIVPDELTARRVLEAGADMIALEMDGLDANLLNIIAGI